ncbi:uncharacterized protein LOC127584859 [Pristis pectinata]|uniref:uncharacterized protein LOC127584859 n=1 Tax=Pristis pectinata TaxID=685728 RepID=UPI00223DEF97|nr:uncharacterized protein LOC127584859 [Pristis pectinata]
MSGQILKRPKAPQSSNPSVAQRLNLLWKYLDAAGLQKCMEDLCAQLLRSTELPQNPYPRLFRQIQQQAEWFRLTNSMPSERILSDLNFPTFSTAIGYISGARNSSHVWGLPSVLCSVSPAQLTQYSWLLASVTPPPAGLHRTPAYSVQVLSALTGPAIFTGTFYDLPPTVDILLNFVIIGSDLQRAVSVYAECLRNDISRTIKQQNHLVFRLVVPVDKNGQNDVFSRDQLMNLTEGFHSSVSAAIAAKQLIRLECLWRLNITGEDFLRGAKLYTLTIVQPSDGDMEERIFDYSELPLIHLYSSVFLRQTHAEAYCGIFIPREEAIDKDLQLPRMKATHNSRGGEWPSSSQKHISTSSKVSPHGFQCTEQGKHGPDSSSVLETIRASMLQRIACVPLSTGAFDIIYFSILIILMELGHSGNQEHSSRMPDREQHLLEALVQLYRFLHGSASRIWNIINLNQTICLLLESEDTEVNCREIFTVLAEKCRKLISDFLDSDYRKVSSDFVTLSKVLKMRMESALHALLEDPHRKLLNNFREMCSCGTVMLLQAVEDSLPWVPVLTDMKKQAEEASQGTGPDNKQVNSEGSPQGAPPLPHTRGQYINVAGSASNVKAPGQDDQDGREDEDAALIKYCVDSRLDWHWEQCLQAIFSESPLPPNPYPIVASEFIKASLRMELWRKRDEEVIHQILQCSPKLIDHENHIFQVPGFEVFGLKSALCTLNPNTFPSVLGLISMMGNSNFPHRCQDFKVALGLGVNTSTTWLGSLSPFLNVLELTEFYYLKGPPGCHREALQAYAKIVQSHLKDLRVRLKGAPMFTVWLSEGNRWSVDDILTYRSAFIEAFADCVAKGHQAYLKVLLSAPGSPWQYLPTVKYFVLYYFEDQEERWRCFPHHDSVGLYHNVFLSKEAATFHFRRVGPPGDPFSGSNLHRVMMGLDADILKSFLKEDILNTYRLAALKCLIGPRYDIIPACWRMLHSAAAQLDYLNRLNETIQELLSVENMNDLETTGASLDEALLMYQQELQTALENQSCPVPAGLLDLVLSKIQAVDARAGGRGNPDQLRDVAVMCQAVADVVAWEIHALCPEMESLLHSLNSSMLQAAKLPPPAEGPGVGAVTPDDWTSQETPVLINTGREALEGW